MTKLLGAFHSTKISEISGPKLNGTVKIPVKVFENLGIRFGRVPFDQKFRFEFPKFSCVEYMERYFPPGRTDLVQFPLEHISHQELLEKMLKDHDESGCFKCRIKLLHE